MKRKQRDKGQQNAERLRPSPARKEIVIDDLRAIVERAASVLPPGDVETLTATVDTLVALTQELETKGTSIWRLRHLLFGPRTESKRRIFPPDTRGKDEQPETGDEDEQPETRDEDEQPTTDKETPADKPKRKGHGRIGADQYKGADKVAVRHESLTPKSLCPCCDKGKVYLQNDPATLVRVTGMAPLSAIVYEKERLRCNACGEVFTAESPEGVGDEKYDESVPSMIGMLKYGAGVPFYRLEKLQKSLGIPLPSGTQWDLVESAANVMAPAHQELVRQAAQGTLLHNDDTTMKILDLDPNALAAAAGGKDDRTGVFTTGIVSTVDDHPVALFFTGVRHAGENLAAVLKQRAADHPPPIQMCDALSRNTKDVPNTLVANCLAHGRRNFVEIAHYFPDESLYVIEALAEVYKNDADAREQKMSDDERLLHHQQLSGPTMDALLEWLRKQLADRLVEPNSSLGGAIRYLIKHWTKLTLFLRVPGAPLDNNICERALKRAVLHRKNSLFYKTLNGARVGDIFMSLIHTAELNGCNTFEYLLALQRNEDDLLLRPSDWMPWNYTARLQELAGSHPDP